MTRTTIDVSDTALARIRSKVYAFDWDQLPARAGWLQGTDRQTLRELTAYWLEEYDWRATERDLNRFEHHIVDAGPCKIHVMREPGSADRPRTMVLLHGWPYSFASFRHVVDRLAHPERHGGDARDGVTVIVPSLPGYALSGLAEHPLGGRTVGRLLDTIVTTAFGAEQYFAHGGDQGAAVAEWMAFDHPERCAGLHTNLLGVRHDGAPLGSGLTGAPDASAEETEFVADELRVGAQPANAYLPLQLSAPQTLAAAMTDSPVGLAAWMLEKFYLWSDRRGTDGPWAVPKPDALTEIMVYLVTNSVGSSFTAFADLFTEAITLPPGRRIEAPSAFAAYADPRTVAPPAGFIRRSRNLVRHTEPPRGGHFPALEAPDLFADDLAGFVKTA